jgi:hypothetical protein
LSSDTGSKFEVVSSADTKTMADSNSSLAELELILVDESIDILDVDTSTISTETPETCAASASKQQQHEEEDDEEEEDNTTVVSNNGKVYLLLLLFILFDNTVVQLLNKKIIGTYILQN